MRRKEGIMKEEENTGKHRGSLIKNLNEAIEPDEVLSGSIVKNIEETHLNRRIGKAIIQQQLWKGKI